MKCPLCSVDLKMADRHGVEIDYCPKCRGVWLDRGELDKIIEKATGPMVQPEPEPAPQPQVWQEPYRDRPAPRREDDRHDRYAREARYRDDRDDRGYYKKKRRKSILSEIFDFD